MRRAENGRAGQKQRNARDEREKETAHPEQQQPVTGCLFQNQSGVLSHADLIGPRERIFRSDLLDPLRDPLTLSDDPDGLPVANQGLGQTPERLAATSDRASTSATL